MPPTAASLYAVIMAGGKGTRFWPLSREAFPKQFLKILGERTLLQETIHRLEGHVASSNMFIVTTGNQRDIVEWQLREMLGEVNCIVEPAGKNTAPAIALSTFKLYKRDPKAVLLVLPSDHYIADSALFGASLKKAMPSAEKGRIVTFGVRPARPETGYGYINSGKQISNGVFDVKRFVEKPDAKTAAGYIKEGSYYWNSGIFLFRAKDMLDEFKKHMPELYAAFHKMEEHLNTDSETQMLEETYRRLAEESIDYGVMEKSSKIAMVEADFRWSDIGSWSALAEVLDRDPEGNVRVGNVVGIECSDSIFFAGERLVAALGLKGMVVVDTADATLIMPREKVQDVKELVNVLKSEGKAEYLAPKIEERPWGYFSILEKGPTHQIKHLFLKPKARLSLQMHNHRSEHWIVVSGVAKVQKGEEIFYVHKNESAYIPQTVKHRLENPGLIPLRIVEVQSGEHLGEDDIVRFEDIYGRKTK